MSKRINISQLAEYCHVSQCTVSKTFNGTGKISAETKARIFEAASNLNYVPQQTVRKDTIAIILSSEQSLEPPSWFASMICSVLQRTLVRGGYSPMLYYANDLRLIHPSFNAAAIALNWSPEMAPQIQLVAQRRPVICINSLIPHAHSVCTDHSQEIRIAVEYLFRKGHRKIGLLCPDNQSWGHQQRLAAYCESMKNVGQTGRKGWIVQEPDALGSPSVETVRRLLKTGVTAVISPHEDWTLSLYHCLGRLGVRIPDDLSVISGEIPWINQLLDVPQTTVAQDMHEMADAVLGLLRNVREGVLLPEHFQQVLLPCHLIERDSVRNLN